MDTENQRKCKMGKNEIERERRQKEEIDVKKTEKKARWRIERK